MCAQPAFNLPLRAGRSQLWEQCTPLSPTFRSYATHVGRGLALLRFVLFFFVGAVLLPTRHLWYHHRGFFQQFQKRRSYAYSLFQLLVPDAVPDLSSTMVQARYFQRVLPGSERRLRALLDVGAELPPKVPLRGFMRVGSV